MPAGGNMPGASGRPGCLTGKNHVPKGLRLCGHSHPCFVHKSFKEFSATVTVYLKLFHNYARGLRFSGILLFYTAFWQAQEAATAKWRLGADCEKSVSSPISLGNMSFGSLKICLISPGDNLLKILKDNNYSPTVSYSATLLAHRTTKTPGK